MRAAGDEGRERIVVRAIRMPCGGLVAAREIVAAAFLAGAQRAGALHVAQDACVAPRDQVAVQPEIVHASIEQVGRTGPRAGERAQLAWADSEVLRHALDLAAAAALESRKAVAPLLPGVPALNELVDESILVIGGRRVQHRCLPFAAFVAKETASRRRDLCAGSRFPANAGLRGRQRMRRGAAAGPPRAGSRTQASGTTCASACTNARLSPAGGDLAGHRQTIRRHAGARAR